MLDPVSRRPQLQGLLLRGARRPLSARWVLSLSLSCTVCGCLGLIWADGVRVTDVGLMVCMWDCCGTDGVYVGLLWD